MRKQTLSSSSSRAIRGARRFLVGGAVLLGLITGFLAACGSEVSSAGGSGGSGASGPAGPASTGAGAGGSTSSAGGCGGEGFTGQPEWTKCSGPGECRLREEGCCEACGPSSLDDAIAIRFDASGAVGDAICAHECTTTSMCPDVDCAWITVYVTAVCRMDTCNAIDIRTDELSACSTDSDCTLRWGVNCCELCATDTQNTGLVAVRKTPSYSEALCNPETPCPPCAPPPYPANASAVCNSTGHCEVLFSN